ncbi:MAG: hypothetical protein ACOY0T_28575 [Myxococcota bacterium]
MIYKSALVAVAAVALVVLLTGKNTVVHRTLVLNGLKYEIARFSNDTVEVVREDGLRFTVDMQTGAATKVVGTQSQLEDALAQLKASALAQLRGNAVAGTDPSRSN